MGDVEGGVREVALGGFRGFFFFFFKFYFLNFTKSGAFEISLGQGIFLVGRV